MTKNRGDQDSQKSGGEGSGSSKDPSRPIRDNSKKSESTVSFDRPTPQKPSKD